MSKVTTTLFEIIKSELINSGKNEFFNKGKLTFFNDEFTFIKKIMNFDDDVKKIVDKKFFLDYNFPDSETDYKFKKMYINKFMEREINRQTLEAFASQNVYVTLMMEEYIINLYENMKKIINGDTETYNIQDNKNVNNYRNMYADQPQTETNMSLDDVYLTYATNNTISKNRDEEDRESYTIQKNYDAEKIKESMLLLDSVLEFYDKKCFLQTW